MIKLHQQKNYPYLINLKNKGVSSIKHFNTFDAFFLLRLESDLMEDKKLCGLYMRVSTEDQARESFSLPEQKERLEAFCKFKDYKIVDYYTDAGISAKTGNYRPEFERLKEDIKNKIINTIVALKLDRITKRIYDWEKLMNF